MKGKFSTTERQGKGGVKREGEAGDSRHIVCTLRLKESSRKKCNDVMMRGVCVCVCVCVCVSVRERVTEEKREREGVQKKFCDSTVEGRRSHTGIHQLVMWGSAAFSACVGVFLVL